MDSRMNPGIPGQLQTGNGQIPSSQRSQGQTVFHPVTQRQMQIVELKSGSDSSCGPQQDPTYCDLPVEYMQRLHPNQPRYLVGPPYYGQPAYHSQQVVVNQPVLGASPPMGQNQSLYFRPSHNVGIVYSRMQGSSPIWSEYRMRMERVPLLSPGQHGSNSSHYVNSQFGSLSVSPLEGRQLSGPDHGYGPGLGYHGLHVQLYQPCMATSKSSSMGWHPADHSVQHSSINLPQQQQQQHKQSGHPISIGEAGFPKHPSAMHLSMPNVAAAGQAVVQNYLPGRRLEHFSPGIPGHGSSTLSPSILNVECFNEFSGLKTQPMGNGATEFVGCHYPVCGSVLSPQSRFRQGAPLHGTDVGDMQQGPYASHAYTAQAFGEAFHPRCLYPNTPSLWLPNSDQYASTKCEPSNTVGHSYGQVLGASVDCSVVSSAAQSDVLRETSEQVSDVSEMDSCLISGHVVTSLSILTLSSPSSSSLSSSSSSPDRASCTISPQLSSSMIRICAANDELNKQNVSSKLLLAKCCVSSLGTVSSGHSLFSAACGSSCGDVVLKLESSYERKDAALDVCCTVASTLPGWRVVSTAAVTVTHNNVVTQMASTSTTYAMTTSTAASVSRHRTMATAVAAAEQLAPPTVRNLPAASLESDFFTSTRQEQNLGTVYARLHDSPPSSDQSDSLASLRKMTQPSYEANSEQTNKATLTMCKPLRKPTRAKRKVKLKQSQPQNLFMSFISEIPKTEARSTSIRLNGTNDLTSSSQESLSYATSETMKRMLDPLSKEPCLNVSAAVKDTDLPAFETPSIATSMSCLQRVDVADVKLSPGKRPVAVPFGWKRKLVKGRVVYISPTAIELDSLDELRRYLLSEGTCKCGLQCPLVVDQIFLFDPDVESRHLCANDVRCDADMTNLCNHKRKIVAMATFQHSTELQMNLMDRMQFQTSSAAAVPSVGFKSRSELCSLRLSKVVRKVRKKVSNKEKPYSCILEKSMPCPNIDVRQIIQEQQERIQGETPSESDPKSYTADSADTVTTFLKKQTVLVDETMPVGLSHTSPSEDSDVMRSVSTACGSTDDISWSHSSPIENTFIALPSAACPGDIKICDDALQRTLSAPEISVNSLGHSSSTMSEINVQRLCRVDAGHPPAASLEVSVHKSSSTGTLSSCLNVPVATASMAASNADREQLCFTPSLDSSRASVSVGGIEFEMPTDQVPAGDRSAQFFEPVSQNYVFACPGMQSHRFPQYPYHSNHLGGNIRPAWPYLNTMHSRNRFCFPPVVERNPASFIISSSNNICSDKFLNQQELSCLGRSQYVGTVPYNSVANVEAVSKGCGILRPVLHACSLGAYPRSESFAPFAEGAGSGVMSRRCPAETRESYICAHPSSGCTSKDDSPITLVQNMVSCLVTTQNSLAMVTSMIVNQSGNSKRRKSGSCSDPNRTALCQPASVAVLAGDEVGMSTTVSSGCLEMLPSTSLDCEAVNGPASSSADTGLLVNLSATEASSCEHFTAAKQPDPMTAVSGHVAQVIPTAGIQLSFGHTLQVPPTIVQLLNPLNISIHGAPILLNDQVLAFGGQDSTLLQQGLSMPGVGQPHVASHPPQGQMAVIPTGQGTAMVAVQPSHSALVSEFPVDESNYMDESGQAGEEVAGTEDLEQMEAEDMMRTTGTQTSTPASNFSNCNSIASVENEMDNSEVLCSNQIVSSSTREDVAIVIKDSCSSSKRATRKAAQPSTADVLQQGQMSSAQVVVMPSVAQQPFVLPQGVAFAGALDGQGYFQLQQPPVDFGFNAGQVGLIHFGQITGTGGLIPTQAVLGAVSVAGGGIISTLVAPDRTGPSEDSSSKPEPNSQPPLGTAEILHLMSSSVPQGHILVQNVPAAFAPFAGAILPIVPPAALGISNAICNFGGTQAVFAMSQGSLGVVPSVETAAMHLNDRPLVSDAAPEAPDSTVDSEEPVSSNVVESDSIAISTNPCLKLNASAEERVILSSSGMHTRPTTELGRIKIQEYREKVIKIFETAIDSPVKSAQLEVPDDGMCNSGLPSNEGENSPVHPDPSCGSSLSGDFAPVKLVKQCKKRKLRLRKRRKHKGTYVGPASNYMTQMTELPLNDDAFETEETAFDSKLKRCTSPAQDTASNNRTIDESNKFSEDLSKSLGSSSATASVECHVTTSVSCDHGDASTCRAQRFRGIRFRTKIGRTRAEQLNSPKCTAVKRPLAEEVNRIGPTQDADDADSTTGLPSVGCCRSSFNLGDLVWGPAKGFLSWPGKLVPETEVRGNPKTESGKIWVKWFGDHTFAQTEPNQLKTLSEGLETHHNALKKHRKGRRMNTKLEAAIQEAMVELDRQMVEQSTLNSSPSSVKAPPAPRHWGSRRTKK